MKCVRVGNKESGSIHRVNEEVAGILVNRFNGTLIPKKVWKAANRPAENFGALTKEQVGEAVKIMHQNEYETLLEEFSRTKTSIDSLKGGMTKKNTEAVLAEVEECHN